MTKKILSLLGPVFVIAAFMALPAMASAAPRVRKSGGAHLEKGDPVRAFSENLVTRTVAGALRCARSDLVGEATSNTTVRITGGSFKGRKGGSHETPCGTDVPGIIEGTMEADITLENLDWCLTLNNNDTWVVDTCGRSEPIAFTALLRDPVLGPVALCRFETPEVTGTYSRRNSPAILTVGRGGPPPTAGFIGSGSNCPPAGELEGSFELTSNGGPLKIDDV